jgi:thymidylate kinase
MSAQPNPLIISFSGIDGAGKSTQITALTSFLQSAGLRTKLLTFWDDVVVFSRYREYAGHKAFGGEMGIGSPDKPVDRRDKNVKSWPITLMRFLMYAADSVSLRLVASSADKTETNVIIFDRYIYDELANLPLQWTFTRMFVRALLRIVPAPDLAFLIDAVPSAARARKPEYPLEFLHANREAYLALNRITGQLTVIAPSSVEESQARIRQAVLARISPPQSNFTAVPAMK